MLPNLASDMRQKVGAVVAQKIGRARAVRFQVELSKAHLSIIAGMAPSFFLVF